MKTLLRCFLFSALPTLFLLVALVLGSLPQSVARASSFSLTKKNQPPPTPLIWDLKLYVNGQYFPTSATINKHLKIKATHPLKLEAKWEGGTLPKGYAVRFSDGGTFLGKPEGEFLGEPESEGKKCGEGAAICTFTDKRTDPIPNRYYYAELLCPLPCKNTSTFKDNRVYVDWISWWSFEDETVPTMP